MPYGCILLPRDSGVVKGSIYGQAPESAHVSEGVTHLFKSFAKLQFNFQPNELVCLWS